MALISFYSKSEISISSWENICRLLLKVTEMQCGDDGLIYFPENTGETATYIEVLELSGGEFKYRYDVYWKKMAVEPGKRQEIDVLIEIARLCKTELLVSGEDHDPFLFIHVEPDGQTSKVGVEPTAYDDLEELIIERIWEAWFGSFATEEALTDAELKVLEVMVSQVISSPEFLKLGIDEMNNDFTHNRKKFEELSKYDFFYGISCTTKTPWLSGEEREIKLLEIMKEFQAQTKKNFCIFPPGSGEVKNIPGGSDSEHFCINITKSGYEKIIYRPRRVSWI